MQYPTLKRNTNFFTKRSFKKKFIFHRVNDPQKSSSITLIIKIKLCRTNAQKPIRKKIQKISKIQGGTEIEINKRDRAKKKKCSTPPSPLIGQIKIAIFATTERVTQAHDEWNPRISNSSRHGGRQFTVGTRPKRIVARSSDVSLTQDARQDERSPICLPAVCQLARDSIRSRAKRERERVIFPITVLDRWIS